jgi:L-glyceraldehyde 3-phosphate reductase
MINYFPNKNRYLEMKYNRVGNSGLKLPAVSAGLWQHELNQIDSIVIK